MACAFVGVPVWARNAHAHPRRARRATATRGAVTCVMPPASGDRKRAAREAEIASKIDMLRRQQKRKAQDAARSAAESGEPVGGAGGDGVTSADGKVIGLFASDINEGEAFFGTARKQDGKGDAYRPKVSTWGVFERPDNISKAFGGGRKLPVGGAGAVSAAQRECDARVAEKLARYRGGSADELAIETEHARDIEEALASAAELCARGRAFEATRVLRAVLPFAGRRTRRGGELRLALALACEECGRRDEAREIYAELMKCSAQTDIRRKARRLVAGFADMEMMRVEDGGDGAVLGFRASDFVIPDLASNSDKRYNAVVADGGDARRDSGGDPLSYTVLVALVAVPLLVIAFLRMQLAL